MATTYIYRGDTISVEVTITLDAAEFEIPLTATVRAGLRKSDEAVGGPWTCSSATTGADWSTGIIVFEIDGTDSLELTPMTRVQLEVEVDDSGEKQTWLSDGTITIREHTIV